MISKTTNKSSARFLLLFTAGALALGGCARIRDNEGYVRDNALMSAIAPGVDNRESVELTLGRPTFESQWDDSVWYYVSRNTEQLAFLAKDAIGQRVTIVRFDADGNVASIDDREGLDQVAYFDPHDDETPVFGRDTGLFQEIFGNIGRVSSIPTGQGGPPR
ncbi:MAG: outer membrane protein assembly factor BamE [Pacificimonas sp.]|jgi:outer membrane protein assembly factor BamE (lipoprotein component of BamABCDE complex)|nr:outer membrane protein assembly factor BamE [Pacificimonas sp.]